MRHGSAVMTRSWTPAEQIRQYYYSDRALVATLSEIDAPIHGIFAQELTLRQNEDGTYHDHSCRQYESDAVVDQLTLDELGAILATGGPTCQCLYAVWANTDVSRLLHEIEQLHIRTTPDGLNQLGVAITSWVRRTANDSRLDSVGALYAWWCQFRDDYPNKLDRWTADPCLISAAYRSAEQRWQDSYIAVLITQRKHCGKRRRARMNAVAACVTDTELNSMLEQSDWADHQEHEARELHRQIRNALAAAWPTKVWIRIDQPCGALLNDMIGLLGCLAQRPDTNKPMYLIVPAPVAHALAVAGVTTCPVQDGDSAALAGPAAAVSAGDLDIQEALDAARLLLVGADSGLQLT